MNAERAMQLYQAVQLLRDFKREAALVQPELTIVAPPVAAGVALAVALEPATEAVLSAIFEIVSTLEQHKTTDAAREARAAQLRALAQSEIDANFPNG